MLIICQRIGSRFFYKNAGKNGNRSGHKQLVMSTKRDYYEVLGIERNAGEDDIRKAVSYTHLTLPTTYSV